MRSKIYKKLILPVISGILAITTGCSNIPVVNSTANTSYLSTAQSVSLSNSDNDLNKIFNSEYKRFSTKNADNGTESIALSKRYVLSTKTVQTYQPSDNDSGGQSPNRIKITADIKKTNATGGVNFVIDGVTTFTAPGTAGAFANGMGNVIDYNTNFFRYEFIWDGKYTDGRVVEDGVYAVHALKNTSGTKTLGLDIEVEVTSDPLIASGLEFYKPEDFSLLASKVNELQAPQADANKLYDVVQEIEVLNTKISNLQARSPVDTAKISVLQSQLSAKNTEKTALENSLTSSINALSVKKDALRSYVNTITKNSTFSQDYPSTDKPTDIYDYDDLIYFRDRDFSNVLSEPAFYLKDQIVNERYDVDYKRLEKTKVYNILDASNVLSSEAQTLKNLLDDYSQGKFDISGLNGEPENLKALKTVANLIEQIKNHSISLKPISLKASTDLKRKYDSMYQDMKDLHQSVQIPIALAMREEPNMQNNPYVIQALKPLPEKFTVKSYTEWVTNLSGLLYSFEHASDPVKIRAIRYVMHYDQAQWDALPQTDRDELLSTFSEVTSAIVPTTPSEILTNFAIGKVLKVAGKVSKATIGIFKKKPTTALGMLDELDDINKLIRKEQKVVSKNVNTVSDICSLRFGTKSICDPDFFVNKEIATPKNFKFRGQTVQPTHPDLESVIEEYFLKKFLSNKTFREEAINNFKSTYSSGIQFSDNFSLPNFSSYSKKDITLSNGFSGNSLQDINDACSMYAQELFDSGKITKKTIKAVKQYLRENDLVWHHSGDLATLKLIPKDVHSIYRHAGGDSYTRAIKEGKMLLSEYTNLAGSQNW